MWAAIHEVCNLAEVLQDDLNPPVWHGSALRCPLSQLNPQNMSKTCLVQECIVLVR